MQGNFLGKRRKGMLIFFLQLSIVEFAVCEETSSFLTNVLIKIQRERLGLIDNYVSTSEKEHTSDLMLDEDNNDYIYVNDEDSSLNDPHGNRLSPGKYDYASYNDLESGGSKVNSNHVEPNLAAPTRDGIYIYNDTIYLYKAPKLPNLKGHAHFDPSTSGIPLHKYKIIHQKPTEVADIHMDQADPDAFINMMMPEDEEVTETPTPAAAEGHKEDEIVGHYYYYYPLDKVPPEFADVVAKILSKPGRPIKPGMVIKPAKKPGGMMPMKPGGMMPLKMMKKPKQPVGPLFKAMALFVGTAVAFIVSILLLPRVKLVKAKNLIEIRAFGDPPLSTNYGPF